MKKEDFVKLYGEAAYEKLKEQMRSWRKEHPEEVIASNQRNNPEQNRKGGRRYAKKLEYEQTGLRGERNRIRRMHANRWWQYKNTIAPESQLHHQWRPESADYDGVALVEKDQHQHGIIDVIQILDGEITLLTEEEIKERTE